MCIRDSMEALRYVSYLKPTGWIVTNTAPFVNIDNYPEENALNEELERFDNVVAFDMDAMAKEVATARASNMVLLGAAAPFIDMEVEKIEDGIRTVFGAKGENIVETNIKAFRAGYDYTRNLLKTR